MLYSLNLPTNRWTSQRIALLFIILIAVAIVIFSIGFVFGVLFEPIDPFPRAEMTAQCSNNTSVVFYQQKTAWFASEIEWSVKQFDGNGKLIRRQSLFMLHRWNDSEMHRTPEEFCDEKYWTRLETLPHTDATQQFVGPERRPVTSTVR
jgi:hypothetical protein